MEIITTVTDELYDELSKLAGQKVVSFSRWDESLADALVGKAEGESTIETAKRDWRGAPREASNNGNADGQDVDSLHVDIDLYLKDGVYFELYSLVCFPDLQSDPITQAEAIDGILAQEIQRGVWLDEIAVDEESQLVLVLSRNHQPVLLLVVGGWTVDGWEELPE